MRLDDDNTKIALVIESAIQMEKDGIEFYSEAAKKIDNPLGSEMFMSFVQDEQRHLEKLKEIMSNDNKVSDVGDEKVTVLKEKIKTIFSDIPQEVAATLQSNAEEKEILQTAIKMEEEGIKYYTDKCISLGGTAGELCSFIVKEEKNHRQILQNTLEYLQDNTSWNIETEGWTFEG
ncbi:ferritin family protein [Elusimicrobiota bacterium]